MNPVWLRNMGWNLLGQLAPMAAALFAIPVLLREMGIDRFGLLTIGWLLIGYFSLFDLGLGRALTQRVASARANGEPVANSIKSALWLMLLLGLLAGLLLALLADWLAYSLLKVPPALRAETRDSLWLLAPAMPLVVLATGLRGILEALQAFRLVNLVRMPLGVLTFVAPLAVLPFSNSLVPLFAVLSLLRLLTLMAFGWACQRAMPGFAAGRFERACLPPLLQFGGWMTLSNLIGPLMVNMDRLLIASLLSLAAVSYYSTPHEMIMRALVVPGAVAGVCFPIFAASNAIASRDLFWRSCKLVGAAMLAMLLLVLPLAQWLLAQWLGSEFARHSTPVLRVLAIGVAINGLAHIPFAYVQGIGQSKVTAQFHVLELVLYGSLLWLCMVQYGIVGAAVAWTLRATLDAACLFIYAQRHLRTAK